MIIRDAADQDWVDIHPFYAAITAEGRTPGDGHVGLHVMYQRLK
ncbi:hypothetical protein [Microtetraspora malaysiensis]